MEKPSYPSPLSSLGDEKMMAGGGGDLRSSKVAQKSRHVIEDITVKSNPVDCA